MFFNTAIIKWVIGVVKILYRLSLLHKYIYPVLSVIYLQLKKKLKNIFSYFTCQVSINLNIILFSFIYIVNFLDITWVLQGKTTPKNNFGEMSFF